MEPADLDDVDRRILHLLQRDARNLTPVDMAEELSVSDGTVRNRIEDMEDEGVIEGYVPVLNYEEAGFPLSVLFHCTADISERSDVAESALDVQNVMNVREMLTAKNNVQVLITAAETEDIVGCGERLVDLGLTIEREELMREEHVQPAATIGEGEAEGA